MSDGISNVEWILDANLLVSPTAEELVKVIDQYRPIKKSLDDPVTVMVLGLPGAGKGTRLRAAISDLPYDIKLNITGNVMAELARQRYSDKVKTRDQIRLNLTSGEQEQLQLDAVKRIGDWSKEPGHIHLIDCHTTTVTKEGYLLGLTPDNLRRYAPDSIIYLAPPLDEIIENRKKDDTRRRDVESLDQIRNQDRLNLELLRMISERTGIPLCVDYSPNGTVPCFVKFLQDIVEELKPVKLYSVAETNTKGSWQPETTPFLTEKSFVDNISDKVQEVAKSVNRVGSRAVSWSQQTNRPVYLVNNEVGGAVFQYGMPHWLSQFSSKREADAFAEKVRQNVHWKNYKLLGEKPFAIRFFLTEGRPGVHDEGNQYILDQVDQFRQGQYDMAILETAREFMGEGKLNSFVYSIEDTLVPQTGDFVHVSPNKARIGDVAKIPGINVMVTDTYRSGTMEAFVRYDKELINYPITQVEYGNFDLSTLDWQNIDSESDFLDFAPDSLLITRDAKKPSFFPSWDKPWPGADELDELGVIYYDPYADGDRSNAWWAGVPEVVYGATNVMCRTSLGPITLKDFLRVKVGQVSEYYKGLQYWEHEVENLLKPGA